MGFYLNKFSFQNLTGSFRLAFNTFELHDFVTTLKTRMSSHHQPNAIEPTRLTEKSQLQELNERFSSYIKAIRTRREKENEFNIYGSTNENHEKKMENQKQFYENELYLMQNELQNLKLEKSDLEAVRLNYDVLSSEFEERISGLNDSLRKSNDQTMKLQVALSGKDLDVEKLRTQLTVPQSQVEILKIEMNDLLKRLAESEKRCTMHEQDKLTLEAQLADFQTRFSFDVQNYQQEIATLQERLGKSRDLTLELEQALYKSGQHDESINQLIQDTREKSEMELRRYMDQTEMKHNSNISEIKMRVDADSERYYMIDKENENLQSHLNLVNAELNQANLKLAEFQSQNEILVATVENERKTSKVQTLKLEKKLQETQDLLMVKIEELSACQENYIPLQAEIENLKHLIEQEENRLGMENTSYFKTSLNQMGSLPLLHQQQGSGSGSLENSNFSLHRPNSVPLVTDSFVKAPPGVSASEIFQMPYAASHQVTPQVKQRELSDFVVPAAHLARSCDEIKRNQHNSLAPSAGDGAGKCAPQKLPRRPMSAANTRVLPAESGEGIDYFESLFKDTKRSASAKPSASYGSRKTSSSTLLDLQNSTAGATGNLKIAQVDEDGMFIRIHNTSQGRVEEIGNCMLQQNVGGHPVAVFRFPPRTKLQPGHTSTVWSSKSKKGVTDSPSNFLWKQLNKWGTGPECTTILCKPNGQAVAWMTSAPRISRMSRSYHHQSALRADSDNTKKVNEF